MNVEGLSVLFVVAVFVGGIALWRPILGLGLYASSVALDYLLAVAGFRLPSAISIGQLALMLLLVIGSLRKRQAQDQPDDGIATGARGTGRHTVGSPGASAVG